MSNKRNKKGARVRALTNEDWDQILNLYYDEGYEVAELANLYKIEQKYIHAAIRTDKTNRQHKGEEMRKRKVKKKKNPITSSTSEVLIQDEEAQAAVAVAVINPDNEVKMVNNSRKKLPVPDNFVDVYNKYVNKEEGYKTYAQAAAALGVSAATFQRWFTAYKKYLVENFGEPDDEGFTSSVRDAVANVKIPKPKEEPEKEEPPKKEEVKKEVKKEEKEETKVEVKEENKEPEDKLRTNIIFNGDNTVKAGMVGGRHDLPVDLFIFEDSLDSSQIDDFEWQDKVVFDFLSREIGISTDTRTGKPMAAKDLVLYATGIQSVICSIFKECHENNVNLTVMHYDPHVDDYHAQVVISGNKNHSVLNDMFPGVDTLEGMGITKDDIPNLKSYYNIKKREYDNKGNVIRTLEIVCPYLNRTNDKCYKMLPDLMMDRVNKISLDIYYSNIKDGKEKDIEQRFHCANWR